MRHGLRRGILVLGVLASSVGCGTTNREDENAVVRRVEIERGAYFGVAWPSDDLIVLGRIRSEVGDAPAEVWVTRPDGRDQREVQLPEVPECRRTRYEFPTSLSDGRVALGRVCSSAEESDPRASYAVVAASLTAEQQPTVLAELGRDFHPLGSSWNSSITKGIGGASSGLCASLRWITPAGPEPIPVVIGTGANTWRLAGDGHVGGECTGGRAADPAWSPDDRAIAFLGSPESFGVRGHRRLDKPWNLYVMDAEEQRPRVLTAGIRHARGTAWSPDSRRIAYIAEDDGVFLVDARSGQRRRITARPAQWLAWSPDGDRLAIVVPSDAAQTDDFISELFILEVPPLDR